MRICELQGFPIQKHIAHAFVANNGLKKPRGTSFAPNRLGPFRGYGRELMMLLATKMG